MDQSSNRFIVFLFPVLLLLAGCATPPSQEQVAKLDFGAPPLNYENTIKKHFEEVLFDPFSAHYYFDSPEQMWIKDPPLLGSRIYAGYMVRVGVNAKNRMGGYVGKKMYGFILKDERIIKVLEEFELQNLRQSKIRSSKRIGPMVDPNSPAPGVGGIGAMLAFQLHQGAVVLNVGIGGPAEKSGIHHGDTITHVDGVSLEEMSRDNALARLHGPVGSKTVLTIERGGGHGKEQLTIVREDTSALKYQR